MFSQFQKSDEYEKRLPERLEEAWRSGPPPDLRKLMAESRIPNLARPLLIELVLIDLEHRWRRDAQDLIDDPLGPRPWWSDYIAILPELGPLESLQAMEVASSYMVIRSLGHAVDRQEFLANHAWVKAPPGLLRVTLAGLLDFVEGKLAIEQPLEKVEKSLVEVSPDFSAPLLFSDYLLEAMLGAGGTGKVYRALQKSTGKSVAIKTLLKKRQRDPEAVAQFVEEARIVQRLDHLAIIATHGLGKYPGGGYFLAMDLVVGQNLQSRLETGSLLPPTAAAIVGRVAEAIAYAHSQGVLHGDLKPSNVLLDEAMRPFVVDFGMAVLLRGNEAESPRGGTPAFMAPEQMDETLGPLSPATDIYGLGGLLYATLTGRAPHVASGPSDTLEAMIARPIDFGGPMRKVPEKLIEVCRRSLHADPAQRFATVAEFAAALCAM